MSSTRVLARTAAVAARTDVCVFCQARQSFRTGPRANHFTRPQISVLTSRRNYAQKLDVKRLRADVDKKGRVGWYKMMRTQKILLVEPDVAEAIYNDFSAHKEERKENAKLVKQLMAKYNVPSEHMAGLAIMTHAIPDLSDPAKRALLPPSPHKPTAALLLQACADLSDPLALKHILTAVYLHTYTLTPSARDLALSISKPNVLKYRTALESLRLANHPDPEALTLRGLFLEQENRHPLARDLYEQALTVPWVYTYNPYARHPAQFPLPAPWNALAASLLRDTENPASRQRAQWAFEQGAKKADDPLSWYGLASFQQKNSIEWLQSVSKAAASGHAEAMLLLARFYRDLANDNSRATTTTTTATGLKDSLNWLLGWRKDSPAKLAEEWFEAAGSAGHKGALLEWAEWKEEVGQQAQARVLLERIAESEATEEFADVVTKARGKLRGIRIK